ncbi:hypothetical protein K474DRAFT_1680778 [Panus rudis PR-1116 ss-1]|nr:hypothetical protein K474DRAFT_1680778 [Panus rudis PR-1116 ss-1]
MHEDSTDSNRKSSKTVARTGSSDSRTGRRTKEKNTPPSSAGLVPSHRTPQDSSSGTRGVVSGEGPSGTAESDLAVVNGASKFTDKSGMQGLRDGDTDPPRGAGNGKNSGPKPQANTSGGEMGTKPHGTAGEQSYNGNANVPRNLVNGRKEGSSTTNETHTPGKKRTAGASAATVGAVVDSTDSVTNRDQSNAANMHTGSQGNSGGREGVHGHDMNAHRGSERTVREEGREDNGGGDRNSSGEGGSAGSKEASTYGTTDVAAPNEGRTTTRRAEGHASEGASGTQATSALYGPDPKSVWSNKAPTPILVGGVPANELNTKRCDRERLSATPEPRHSANMKKKGSKAPANRSMPPPPLPARFSSPLTPTSALGTTPGSRSGLTPRPTTPTEWEPTPVSSPEVSLAGAISRAGKANTITYQKAKSATSIPAKPVGPARKGQPAMKTAKTDDPNLARLQSARRRNT